MARDLAAEFAARGPWVTKFVIDGQSLGGDYDPLDDASGRIGQFYGAFPDSATILELGSFEGGHTARLATFPGVTRVVGVEGRPENAARAAFALDVLGVSNVTLHVADLEAFDLTTLGRFDAVFNCGLLYHLHEPWTLLEQIARVSDRMYLSTHVCADDDADVTEHGWAGRWYTEQGYEDRLSGLAPASFWPTRDGLLEMLASTGFTRSTVSYDDPGSPHGPIVSVITRK
jgi:SAM-dependent methyltransferase